MGSFLCPSPAELRAPVVAEEKPFFAIFPASALITADTRIYVNTLTPTPLCRGCRISSVVNSIGVSRGASTIEKGRNAQRDGKSLFSR